MELRLPLVVVHRGRRLVEAWVPGLAGVAMRGPSLAEVRDELALRVMELFEAGPPSVLGAYQLPPHAALRHVEVETVAHDRTRRRRIELAGRIGVLVEKWPGDDFFVATPTRLPDARFALRAVDELAGALPRRLAAYCLEHEIASLEPYQAEQRERLDILEVDADPPSIFPRGPRVRRRPRTARDGGAPAETSEQREERRRRRRARLTALRAVGRNLTHAAHDDALERAFGREALVRELLDELDGRAGAAVVLLGPPGAGKTAVVHEVVRRLAARQAAAGVRRDVWRVDGNRFVAGMAYVGQWEARARELVEELLDLGDVLYIDDLLSMVHAGRTAKGDTNVAQYLEAPLARGELAVVAESTPERFERVREEAPTFAAQFRVVHVPAMTDREALPVLLGVLRDLESDEAAPVAFAPAALEAVLHTTRRFMAHEAFPGKAVRLLRAVVAGPVDATAARRYYAAHVFEAVKRQTGLPDFVLGNQPPRTPEEIRRDLTAMVAGQPEAVDAMVDVVVALQHALGDPDKPLGTYLFVGPTGVGKTETAKALARYLFGSAQRLVRFDMSEFSTSGAIARLVGHAGAPEGELTTALRTHAFCVILFDEIEKADPRVFDALLQLLGEGRLTDAAGRTADARQAVVIMTSNLGVREAAARTGFLSGGEGEARRHYVDAAQRFFRPEFFNRIDRVVPFRSLDPFALRVVVEHALEELLSRRGIRRANVLVDVEPALLDLLVEQAFDPRYGARPLRRALERKLAVPLAHHLVRRRSEDAALVELYRRGDDMGLAVRTLRAASAVPADADTTAWTAREIVAAFDAVRERAERLAHSDEVARLSDARRAALRAVSHAAGDPPDEAARGAARADLGVEIELLDRLAGLQAAIRELEESDLSESHYDEEAVGPTRHALRAHERSDSDHHRYRGGLRPRAGFVEVPMQTNTEAMVRRARPRVAALRDDLEVLAHQLRAAARGPDAPLTVLLECAAGEDVPAAIPPVAAALPLGLARAQTYLELAGDADGAGASWVPHAPPAADPRAAPSGGAPRFRRVCCVLEGAGLAELLAPLVGYAAVQLPDALGPRTVLVRIELLAEPGLAGLDAVRARDARRAAARDARRAAADDAGPLEPGVVVMRGVPGTTRFEHVATGLAAGATEAVAAAMLRAGAAAG